MLRPAAPVRALRRSPGRRSRRSSPRSAAIADDICIVRSMQTEQINHDPAHTFMNTGTQISGRPAAGLVGLVRPRHGRRRPAGLRRPHLPGARRARCSRSPRGSGTAAFSRAASRASTSARGATPSCTCATPRASPASSSATSSTPSRRSTAERGDWRGRPRGAGAARAVRDGVPDADERPRAHRPLERAGERQGALRRRRRSTAASPPTACSRAGWPSAACASSSSTTATGTTTAGSRPTSR